MSTNSDCKFDANYLSFQMSHIGTRHETRLPLRALQERRGEDQQRKGLMDPGMVQGRQKVMTVICRLAFSKKNILLQNLAIVEGSGRSAAVAEGIMATAYFGSWALGCSEQDPEAGRMGLLVADKLEG